MNRHRFSLEPFPSSIYLPDIDISGEIGRSSNILSIGYKLQGTMKELIIPETAESPMRKEGLWEETCLEFFIKEIFSERYWEFNLSPSGDWNVYRFRSYREGMEEETAFTNLPLNVIFLQDSLSLILEFDLEKIIPAKHSLETAVSAVIRTKNGHISYWSLKHPSSKPDFHHKDGFILQI